jgi:hypothetical protein
VGLRDKLKRLERVADEETGVLVLPDGTEVRYCLGLPHDGGDLYEAFLACMAGREHWLLPYVRQMDTTEGFPGLIRAIEGSRERVEAEGR